MRNNYLTLPKAKLPSMAILSASVLLLTLLSTNAQAEIYKWKDSKGITHYTATPPPQKENTKTKVENIGDRIQSAAGNYKAPKANTDEKNSSAKAKNEESNKLSPPDKKRVSYCKNQRKNLSNLKKNYFNVWVDTDGKKTKLDQKQRQSKVNHLIKEIKENCKGV